MWFSKCTPKQQPIKIQRPNVDTNSRKKKVWALFSKKGSPKKERDFIFTEHKGVIFVLSKKKPIATSSFDVISKPFNPKKALLNKFKKGQKLFFDLRADFEKRSKSKKNRKSIAFSYAKKIKKEGSSAKKDQINLGASREWFEQHSKEYGFIVRDYQIIGDDFYDFKSTEGRRVTFNSLDFHGVLEITDPVLFLKTYSEGIGKSRCYGCGMFLVTVP